MTELVTEQKATELVTVQQAFELTGIRPPTWRKWLGERRLGYVRLGRAIRIPLAEIRRLIEQGSVPPIQRR